ncbi:MAG: glycosyltransferase family 2 protein [Planctomycetia bacterium]|nr:glycosyltransferase family 2 protein [Planctomycetia bacterium]
MSTLAVLNVSATSWLALIALALAAIPTLLTIANLRIFARAPQPDSGNCLPQISVLVPARNEAGGIEQMAQAVLASRGVEIELLILDDDSRDNTVAIVSRLSDADARVRLLHGHPLAVGWCGKQHACAQLADAARYDTWVFLDADVTLSTDAIARSVTFLEQSQADLVSGFPRQLTCSFLDWLLLPLIHFVLLGFLPLGRSRSENSAGMAAGCGQLFITRRAGYRASGGHAGIHASLHDGIKLPRAYRRAGLRTDIFDATDTAQCQMYTRSLDVLAGLSKNATEGIGSPATILPFTILFVGGQILPIGLMVCGLMNDFQDWPTWTIAIVGLAVVGTYLPRILAARRFGQSLLSALAHPLGIAIFLCIQWWSLVRRWLGLATHWKGRALVPQ